MIKYPQIACLIYQNPISLVDLKRHPNPVLRVQKNVSKAILEIK